MKEESKIPVVMSIFYLQSIYIYLFLFISIHHLIEVDHEI